MIEITYIDSPSFMPTYFLDQLKVLGNLRVYQDEPSKEEIINRLNSTDVAIVERSNLERDVFENLDKKAPYITLATTSYSNVDIVTARELGIMVSNCPGYARRSVAEYAFALLFATCRQTAQAIDIATTSSFSPTEDYVGLELYGKTLGIIGLGSIGSAVAEIGLGFGMHVIGTSRTPKYLPGVIEKSLEEVLSESDVIVLAVDLNPSTRHFLTRSKLEMLRPGVFLVNIANNKILDEDAIVDLLSCGHIAGVGLDVVETAETSPLSHCRNAVITPAIGWRTQSAIDRNLHMIVGNIKAFLDGSPIHLVT